MLTISAETLIAHEGKGIAAFCDGGYTDASFNHCAHFVSHVMGFTFCFTCQGMTGKGTSPACIRVHDLFARCPLVGAWEDFPGGACLAFITGTGNVHLNQKRMDNVPRKHVGIHVEGKIWHYSNTRDVVVSQKPEVFARHYGSKGYSVFYGTFPG